MKIKKICLPILLFIIIPFLFLLFVTVFDIKLCLIVMGIIVGIIIAIVGLFTLLDWISKIPIEKISLPEKYRKHIDKCSEIHKKIFKEVDPRIFFIVSAIIVMFTNFYDHLFLITIVFFLFILFPRSILYILYYIVYLAYSLLLLLKRFVIFIIEAFYSKKLKNALILAKNFLRPETKQKIGNYVLANKYCTVELSDTNIYCSDKINKIYNNCPLLKKHFKQIILLKLCEEFSFETTYVDVMRIIGDFERQNSLKITQDYNGFQQLSINNMSVAELITLPGINMGKAYKINKYLKYNNFSSVKHFVWFADISNEDKVDILNNYNLLSNQINKNIETNKNKIIKKKKKR